MALIEARGIWKSFGSNQVLKELDLVVERGETVVILGRSGVGKSVLLRLLLGMDKPDRGSITVDGAPVSELRGPKLFEAILQMGMLFQQSALFDSLSVGENTAFHLRRHKDRKTGKKLPEVEVRQRVAEALQLVDLAGWQDAYPSELSGGMRKRAALARLIVYHPEILLYDEPTTGLDPITANQINQLILQIQAELQATSIIVTHDLHSALEVGDRLALHHDGRICLIDTPEGFLQNDHPIIRDFLRNARVDGRLHRKPKGATSETS